MRYKVWSLEEIIIPKISLVEIHGNIQMCVHNMCAKLGRKK